VSLHIPSVSVSTEAVVPGMAHSGHLVAVMAYSENFLANFRTCCAIPHNVLSMM